MNEMFSSVAGFGFGSRDPVPARDANETITANYEEKYERTEIVNALHHALRTSQSKTQFSRADVSHFYDHSDATIVQDIVAYQKLKQISGSDSDQKDQARFRLDTKTIALIKDGLGGYADNRAHFFGQEYLEFDPSQITDARINDLVEERLVLLFSAEARRIAYDGKNSVLIATTDKFTNDMDVILQDRIPYPPRRFADVADGIMRALQRMFAHKMFQGAWGRVYLGVDYSINLETYVSIVPGVHKTGVKFSIEDL